MSNWEKKIKKLLLNKKIVKVQYMSKQESEENGWNTQPIQIMLEDGIWLTPMQDDEGNDGGAICTNSDSLPTIPVNRY
tara:strand:- start:64 stop:297 length:234 start_codon:yes stop_codon:yes gene_type:complete